MSRTEGGGVAPQVLIVRHGTAEASSEAGDRGRTLTPEGASVLRRASAGLRQLGVVPKRVLTSPLLRAVQTAAILEHELEVGGGVTVVEELAPGAEPNAVLRVLGATTDGELVAVVGHMPDVAALAHALVAPGRPAASGFAPGSMALIALEGGAVAGRGRLLWHRTASELGGE